MCQMKTALLLHLCTKIICMKNILLIGSTGFSGFQVLKELLKKGYVVTAITRNTSTLNLEDDNLKIVEGNILNPLFLKAVLENQEAVINCLGIGGKGNGKPNTLLSDSTRILVDIMEKSKTKRLITMSNIGAGDSEQFQPLIFRKFILPYFMKWLKVIIEDKNRMEPIIMNSQLNWTIVRCPNIIEKPAKNRINPTLEGKSLKLTITNEDLSWFIVNQLESIEFLKKAPSISN